MLGEGGLGQSLRLDARSEVGAGDTGVAPVVSASRPEMASAAAPCVMKPTWTPATDVPGAMSTSDAAAAPRATTPAPTPIHRPIRRLRGSGSTGAHS